jgi:hypothetical protein
MRTVTLALIATLTLAVTLLAQEPKAARLRVTSLNQEDGIALTFPWRFAGGDGPGREQPAFDDSGWSTLVPELPAAVLRSDVWNGTGWFRRHVLADPSLQQRTLALRFEARGVADVYLDGKLILSTIRSSPSPEIPADHREAALVRLDGLTHVLAVRYVYPKSAVRGSDPLGFRLSLANPGSAAVVQPWIVALQGGVGRIGSWVVAVQGGIIAMPLFLALLHLMLFAYDRRARENLFFALEMLAFVVVLVNDLGAAFLPSDAARDFVNRINQGSPPVAILFGLLTFYAVRTERFPRTWRLFVLGGIVTFAASYVVPAYAEIAWVTYFALTLVEFVRLEATGRTVRREAGGAFVISYVIFLCTIVLQILINFSLVVLVAGVREVYLLGLLSSAAGMSLYLARRIGQSRVIAAENRRRSEELTQARELQLSMLPRELPSIPELDVSASTQTAAEVGGDYYDVRRDGGGALLFAFGDATGHGLAAGIVVTAAKALFNSFDTNASPRDLLVTCDRTLRAMQLPTLRMCLTLARVSSTAVTVASAAMPPLLIHRKASGAIDELGTGGLPLGSRLSSDYETRQAALHAGDTLLFASDGFAELENADGRQLGYEAVATTFRDAAQSATAREVMNRLEAAASAFRGSRAQGDDITFVVVRVQ